MELEEIPEIYRDWAERVEGTIKEVALILNNAYLQSLRNGLLSLSNLNKKGNQPEGVTMRNYSDWTEEERKEIIDLSKEHSMATLVNSIIEVASRRDPIPPETPCFFGDIKEVGFTKIGFYTIRQSALSEHTGVDLQCQNPEEYRYARRIPEGWIPGDDIPEITDEDK